MSDNDFAFYYALQNEARLRTMRSLNKKVLKSGGITRWDSLTLSSILGRNPGDALGFVEDRWTRYYDDSYSGFAKSWPTIVHKNINDPDHFNLAIWQKVEGEQILVALALGNPSNRRKYLTLKWIERYCGHSHLKGRALWPILTCAEEYAKLLGSERVLIKDPVDQGKYERYGYTVFSHPGVRFGGDYMGKELNYGQ